MSNTDHWEKVYQTKQPHEVSWTQPVPETSLHYIQNLQLPLTASIIDIGGGDSKLVDFLLDAGYHNITVLDISATALEKAKIRLGDKAASVRWITTDITAFEPDTTYDLWHDRATFHFLTTTEQTERYLTSARKAILPGGHAIISTFSDNGPEKCSGLVIRQYNESSLPAAFSEGFEKLACTRETHTTPFATSQEFVFCSFRRIT